MQELLINLKKFLRILTLQCILSKTGTLVTGRSLILSQLVIQAGNCTNQDPVQLDGANFRLV